LLSKLEFRGNGFSDCRTFLGGEGQMKLLHFYSDSDYCTVRHACDVC
jgi:hypothetical protein